MCQSASERMLAQLLLGEPGGALLAVNLADLWRYGRPQE